MPRFRNYLSSYGMMPPIGEMGPLFGEGDEL